MACKIMLKKDLRVFVLQVQCDKCDKYAQYRVMGKSKKAVMAAFEAEFPDADSPDIRKAELANGRVLMDWNYNKKTKELLCNACMLKGVKASKV